MHSSFQPLPLRSEGHTSIVGWARASATPTKGTNAVRLSTGCQALWLAFYMLLFLAALRNMDRYLFFTEVENEA